MAVLVNGYLSAGEHKRNSLTGRTAKGIYLLRLVNGAIQPHTGLYRNNKYKRACL